MSSDISQILTLFPFNNANADFHKIRSEFFCRYAFFAQRQAQIK